MRTIAKILLPACASLMLIGCSGKPGYNDTMEMDNAPQIWPNYSGTTIPAEIAPLNFNFTAFSYNWLILNIKGSISGEMNTEGKHIDMDIDEWHSMASANKGGDLILSLSVISSKKRFNFKPITIHVSQDPLDEFGLTYRLVEPGYISYSMMGIYERNLSNFDQKAIFETKSSSSSCVNCHTPNRTNASQTVFHIRGGNGSTIINDNGKVYDLNMKSDKTIGNCVYPYWHPSGKYIAFSQNQTFQVFHTSHKNKIEVYDLESDLAIYNVKDRELILSPQIKVDSISETFPAFSPDGKTLYYCAAPKMEPPVYLENLRYCLMKADFDDATGKITGEPDTLINIPGKSILFPRPSYDGKYLMFTVCDYGTFPIWHHEADLYMMDLQSKDSVVYFATQDLNSDDTESFHNWSANSKWVVFSSRREDGLYTRLYLAHVEDNGSFGKPFLLPQRNPVKYYNDLFYSYNTPDFCDKTFEISASETRRMANSTSKDGITVKE